MFETFERDVDNSKLAFTINESIDAHKLLPPPKLTKHQSTEEQYKFLLNLIKLDVDKRLHPAYAPGDDHIDTERKFLYSKLVINNKEEIKASSEIIKKFREFIGQLDDMKSRKAKEKLTEILTDSINKEMQILKDLELKLPNLEEPITFHFKRFNELLPTDHYFGKGPRKDSNGQVTEKSIKQYS